MSTNFPACLPERDEDLAGGVGVFGGGEGVDGLVGGELVGDDLLELGVGVQESYGVVYLVAGAIGGAITASVLMRLLRRSASSVSNSRCWTATPKATRSQGARLP